MAKLRGFQNPLFGSQICTLVGGGGSACPSLGHPPGHPPGWVGVPLGWPFAQLEGPKLWPHFRGWVPAAASLQVPERCSRLYCTGAGQGLFSSAPVGRSPRGTMQLCGRAICPQEGHELGKARSTADASEEGLAPHTCDAHAWLCRASRPQRPGSQGERLLGPPARQHSAKHLVSLCAAAKNI